MSRKNEKNQFECELKPDIFNFLTDEEMQVINNNRFEVQFKSGETIFKQGSAFTHIIYIMEGKAKVLLEDTNNRSLLLKILKKPELIGGPGFLTDYRHYFSVVALEDTKACFLDVNIVKMFVESNTQFMLEMFAFLNRGYIEMYEKIKILTNKHMNGRLADALLYLSDKVYNSFEFTTTLNRGDIAHLSSMTKESVIRALKNFKEDGIIECKGNAFKILKRDVLLEISKKG